MVNDYGLLQTGQQVIMNNQFATVTFTDQSGQRIGNPVQVSLGHPAKVTLSMSNVTQLGMTCVGRDTRSGQTASGFQVALGDARIF